jgi:SAM-dependent methyltransferase
MTGPRIFLPDYYARMRALEEASWWNAGMRDAAARLLGEAGLPPGGLLLDAGCGSGQTMAWFRELWPGWRTIGVDVAMEGLRAARAGWGEPVLGASVLSVPLPDASVDAVITLDVLQHLPLGGGDGTALAEFRRVLRPGGWLLIRTNAQAWPRIPDDPEFDFHKYSAKELRQRLAESGFRTHRLGRVNALLGLAEIPRELRAQRRDGPGYSGLLAEVPRAGLGWHLKRAWLRFEGRLVARGLSLPLGRTLLAVAQVPKEASR